VGEVHDAGDHDLVQATCCHVRVDGFIEAMGDDWTHPFIRDLISSGGRAASTMSAITHRRELSERVGGWNAEMDAGADVDLWRRILPIARPVTIAAPTVLHLRGTGRAQSPAERIEQNRNLLERISDPVELARLRAEMGHAVYRRLADHQQEAHHLRLEAEALRKQTRDLNATLDRVVNGRWWRLRGRVLPLIRARSVVARKLDRLRG
jgi:hypothetical protein